MGVNFSALSRSPPPLIKIPASAPFPTPTISAAGVATPRAQGHDIISTATEERIAKGILPARDQPTKERTATLTTPTQNNPLPCQLSSRWAQLRPEPLLPSL